MKYNSAETNCTLQTRSGESANDDAASHIRHHHHRTFAFIIVASHPIVVASSSIVMSSSSTASYTPVASIPAIVQSVRNHFGTHITKSASWRKQQLSNCLRLMTENESAITAALASDMGKPAFESMLAEIVGVETEIRSMLSQIDDWMVPQSVPTPISLLPAHSYIQRDPYGTVLIIGPFNYPFQLVMMPLVACISAGNCAVIKPSDLTPASSALIATLIPKYLDPLAFQVVLGAIDETSALLRERWDYMFFTGSDFVGKIVARAAAENLTPCTLELGGKSPVIIGEDADLALTARRVIWGKTMNAGQTCIAPDYVYVPTALKQKFIDECSIALGQFFAGKPESSVDYGRIVSERHATRLSKLIDTAKAEGKVVVGGNYDIKTKYIEPTIIDATTQSSVMAEELFGPILPIIAYDDINTVISYVNSKPKPLALYVFSTNESFQQRILSTTSSGGATINDVVMQFVNSELPFGGVGNSGQGAYHGKHGYHTFSHAKSVLHKSVYGDAPARYAPYTPFNSKFIRYLSEVHRVNSTTFSKVFRIVVVPLVIAAVAHRAGVTIGFKSNL